MFFLVIFLVKSIMNYLFLSFFFFLSLIRWPSYLLERDLFFGFN